jgi:hypothetical protein
MAGGTTKADFIKFPVSGSDSTGRNTVFRYASSTSTVSAQLPASMIGGFIRVNSIGCDTMVGLSYGVAQGLNMTFTGAIGTSGTPQCGATVVAGSYLDGIVPNKDAPTSVQPVFLNFISSATGGYVEIYVSELRSV